MVVLRRLNTHLSKLTFTESLQLLRPYTQGRFMEQVKAVVPLALYLALFQILILRQVVDDSWQVTGGLFAVIIGLMLFMEGLKLGLMPFGTAIGQTLPKKSPLPLVLLITLLLGIGVTFAEPAIGALKAAGQNVAVESAPYLFALLNMYTVQLVLVIGFSVGAVTTGPVTVPLVLSLGRANSTPCRGVGVLRATETKPGKLPEPLLLRAVVVVVEELEAQEVFEFICETANIARPGGGYVLLGATLGGTPCELPTDIRQEII